MYYRQPLLSSSHAFKGSLGASNGYQQRSVHLVITERLNIYLERRHWVRDLKLLQHLSYGTKCKRISKRLDLTLLPYNWGNNIREINRYLFSHLWMDDAKVPHDLAKGHHPGLSPREESILLTGLPVIAPPCPSLQGRVTPCIYIHASMLRCELGLSV